MKITYKLYSGEYPEGHVLATVSDYSQANVLESYYQRIYGNKAFRVMRKQGRRKEEIVTGYYGL